ncbi:hypothetical protein SO694_00019457 [Aureococcus anophagefferens]|uniref:Myb-like domain-containing protein n=1 Tax=Aureococcus anophagefferens TaxID=44056 RepID=A0ABR1G0A7_AURAN
MEEIETVKAASRLQGPGQREEAVNRLRGLETSGRNLCAQLGLDSSQEGLGRIGGKLAGHIGENRYIVSYATDNRSKCQSVECRQYLRCGETRIGKQPPSVRLGHGKTRWYHLDCAFVAFRRVCRKSKTIEAPGDLEGFETMSEGDKERVRGLIADHVEERAALGPPAKPVEAKVPEGWSCNWCGRGAREAPSRSRGPDGPQTLCGSCSQRYRRGALGPEPEGSLCSRCGAGDIRFLANSDPDYVCGDRELLPPMPRAPRDDRAPQHPRRPPPPPTPAADGAACLWRGSGAHTSGPALSLCGTCGDRYQRGAAGPTGMDQSGECDAGGAKHATSPRRGLRRARARRDAAADERRRAAAAPPRRAAETAAPDVDDALLERLAEMPAPTPAEARAGHWAEDEHAKFLAGLEAFGALGRVARIVGTRTMSQVRSHAQKYFKRADALRAPAVVTPAATPPRRPPRAGDDDARARAPPPASARRPGGRTGLYESPHASARKRRRLEDASGLEALAFLASAPARPRPSTAGVPYGYDGYDSYDGYGYGNAYASRRASPPALVPEWVWKLGSMLVAAAVVCFGFFLVKNVNELFKTNRRSKARVVLPTKPAVEDAKRVRARVARRVAAATALERVARAATEAGRRRRRGAGDGPGPRSRACGVLARVWRDRLPRRRHLVEAARLIASERREARDARARRSSAARRDREAAKKRDKKVRDELAREAAAAARARAAALWSSLRHGDARRGAPSRGAAAPASGGRANGVYRRSLAGAAPLFRRAPRHDRGVVAS